MTTFGLVLDCDDPDKLAGLWSAAVGYTVLGAAGNGGARNRQQARQPIRPSEPT